MSGHISQWRKKISVFQSELRGKLVLSLPFSQLLDLSRCQRCQHNTMYSQTNTDKREIIVNRAIYKEIAQGMFTVGAAGQRTCDWVKMNKSMCSCQCRNVQITAAPAHVKSQYLDDAGADIQTILRNSRLSSVIRFLNIVSIFTWALYVSMITFHPPADQSRLQR